MSFLEVRGLNVAYRRPDGRLGPAVIDAAFTLEEGESLGVVGESGSGKSTLARTLLGYCRPGGVITSGAIRIEGDRCPRARRCGTRSACAAGAWPSSRRTR